MPYLRSLRAGASLIDVFKAFPETSRPLIEFHEALLRGPHYPAGGTKLIAAFVSGLNRCSIVMAHTATAERMGVEVKLRCDREGWRSDDVAPKLRQFWLARNRRCRRIQ
jgi:AhpD family alkylhydroperoxidase